MRRIIDEHEMREQRLVACKHISDFSEIEIGVDIRIHHQKRNCAEQRQCRCNASSRFERLGLVRVADPNAPTHTFTECAHDAITQMGNVDHYLSKSTARERLDRPHDERLAACGKQWLWSRVGQRTHALATPRCENHRLHNCSESVATASGSLLERIEKLEQPPELRITLCSAARVCQEAWRVV